MSVKKLKKIYCRVVGVGELIFFAWMINDMINTLVARGY